MRPNIRVEKPELDFFLDRLDKSWQAPDMARHFSPFALFVEMFEKGPTSKLAFWFVRRICASSSHQTLTNKCNSTHLTHRRPNLQSISMQATPSFPRFLDYNTLASIFVSNHAAPSQSERIPRASYSYSHPLATVVFGTRVSEGP
jgi:hypothetical protein